MNEKRSYRRRGTPDFPVSVYVGISGENMRPTFPAEYHPETEIALQVSGTCTERIGDQLITYQPGDIWITQGNIVHERVHVSDDAVIHWIIFSTEAITMLPDHFFPKRICASSF